VIDISVLQIVYQLLTNLNSLKKNKNTSLLLPFFSLVGNCFLKINFMLLKFKIFVEVCW